MRVHAVQCDECGKLEKTKNSDTMPLYWYQVTVDRDVYEYGRREHRSITVHLCSPECLSRSERLHVIRDTGELQ